MRAVTWNLHGAVGADRRRDIGRCAALLAGLDAELIGLQEVEARPSLSTVDQAADLAGRLGLQVAAGPLLLEGDRGYGNALLSRHPIVAVRAGRFTAQGREPRGWLEVEVQVPRLGALAVIVSHLDLGWRARGAQLHELAALARRAAPCVLLADLNEWWPRRPALRALGRAVRLAPPRATFPAVWPLLALDRIGVRGLRFAGHAAVWRAAGAPAASDHLPLVAELGPPPRRDRPPSHPAEVPSPCRASASAT